MVSGDSHASLSYAFRVGRSTISDIIVETTDCIWSTLRKRYLPEQTEEDWHKVADGFSKRWYFPNRLDAIDGKYIRIQVNNHCCKMVGVIISFKIIRHHIILVQNSTIISYTSRPYCLPYVTTTTASLLLTLVHKDDIVMEVCWRIQLWEFDFKGLI